MSCEEKVPYPTVDEARAAAVLAEWQHGVKLKAYKCRLCGSWHLSSA